MAHDEVITIDCSDCELQATAACEDCVVSFICGRGADDDVVLDVHERRALRLLGDGGLVPALRHRRRA
jgi:hypothetical protein